jgi:hypothetical protein
MIKMSKIPPIMSWYILQIDFNLIKYWIFFCSSNKNFSPKKEFLGFPRNGSNLVNFSSALLDSKFVVLF